MEPDKRYAPICHICKTKADGVYSCHERMIRDMNVFDVRTMIRYRYRKIRCRTRGIVVEDLGLVEPRLRITRRLAQYIQELCKMMTILLN